jgi:hypothetical protein
MASPESRSSFRQGRDAIAVLLGAEHAKIAGSYRGSMMHGDSEKKEIYLYKELFGCISCRAVEWRIILTA